MTGIAVQVYPQHCEFADIRRAFLTAEELGAGRVNQRLVEVPS